MNHCSTEYIETNRLILRQFKVEDAKNMYNNWASDDEVTKFLTWPTHANVLESEEILKEWVRNYKYRDFYQWAIVLKESKEVIGSIGVVSYDEKINMVHIGYCIGKKWWHKDVTSEALKYIIQFFLRRLM